MDINANWSYPTAIRFGAGRISEIAEACTIAGIKNPLLITDRGLSSLDITLKTLDFLELAGLGRSMFSDVDPNPNEKNAAAGIKAYRDGGHDGIIAFGGGSGLDLGKLVAFMAGQTRPLWDFEDIDDWWTRADEHAIAPIVAVPTTAGTGSEVGRASVITNSETKQKKIIFHPKFLPTVVICDPELTIGMPSLITAGTGLDAFAHCVEAFCSPNYHPMSQGIISGDHLILALGAWSGPLAKKLGLKKNVLESERGYHIELHEPNLMPKAPMMITAGKFIVTPMKGRIRCAGVVEFAGIDAPEQNAPIELIKKQVKALFPALEYDHMTEWMGRRPATTDSLPIIGAARNCSNAHIAFGHQHVGLTGGPKTGRLIADMVNKKPNNADLSAFDPKRYS